MGQMVEDEGDEHVVAVVRLGPGIGGVQHGLRLRAGRRAALKFSQRRRARGCLGGPVARVPGVEPGEKVLPFPGVGGGIIGLQGTQPLTRAVLRLLFPGHLVEEHRRPLELIENEDQHAQQQDEELHGNLADAVEHQAEPALAQRRAGEVTLDLGLVGAEIGQREKHPAQHAGPERVAPVEVEREVDCLELVQAAGQRERVGEAEAGGQPGEQDDERRDHPGKDDPDLVFLGQIHRVAAAGCGVDHHEQPAGHDSQVEPPAHHGGKHDGGSVDGDARAQPALHKKQARAEQPRFPVEAPAEVFVGGVDVEPPVNRQKKDRDDDQRQRRAKIVLDEPDPVLIALARDREKGDRARLRGHDGKADGQPARVAGALDIGGQVAAPARLPHAVRGNAHERAEQHEVIEQVHRENSRVNHASSPT